ERSSEPDIVRLVGGSSRCAGELEVKQHDLWRKVDEEKSQWNLKTADSVLVNGNSLCSGRLEVKSNQRWSSVCEYDFDQQDAEVVCRELGCGAPSVLQGALYGEVEAPMWTKEFQCGGHESALLDCRTSGSDRNTCSPGKAVGLTCSGRTASCLILLDLIKMSLILFIYYEFYILNKDSRNFQCCSQIFWLSQTSPSTLTLTGCLRTSSFRCCWAPVSPSAAPSCPSIQEALSS
uniref:SRCR domain-containing protein n=1 Tax=Sparus aurata TaxID=8175 RepID=A0A671TTH7_SPAAU